MSAGVARLFVALDLPDVARVALARWGAGIAAAHPGVRAVAADSLHVTLCFIGDHPADDLERLGDACQIVAGMGPVELGVQAALLLPPRRPRVLAVSLLDPGGALAAIQATLAGTLASLGALPPAGRPERRPFLPHVTVARVRPGGLRISPGDLPAPPTPRLTGRTVTLYESRLGSGPARYEPRWTVQLAPPP